MQRLKRGLLLLATTCSATYAVAGAVSGGGGVGVLCQSGASEKIHTLDIYELSESGRSTFQPQIDLASNYAIALERLRMLAGDTRPVSGDDIQEMNRMLDEFAFVNQDLQPTHDIGPTVSLPAHCRYEQIAVFDDYEEKLTVNKNLWNRLSPLDQASLIMHEGIYRLQRTAFYRDSSYGRAIVGELFAEEGPNFEGVYEGLTPGEGLMCFAGDSGTNTGIRFIWQGKKIHIVSIAGEQRLVKTTVDIPVSLESVTLKRAFIDGFEPAYQVSTTSPDYESKGQTLNSDLPIPHIQWLQKVANGDFLQVGIKVKGRTLLFPVTSCSTYR